MRTDSRIVTKQQALEMAKEDRNLVICPEWYKVKAQGKSVRVRVLFCPHARPHPSSRDCGERLGLCCVIPADRTTGPCSSQGLFEYYVHQQVQGKEKTKTDESV